MSHVCLTMHPNGNLLVYKNCGRPTAEEAKIIKCTNSLRAELRKLKKEMGYAKRTKILLALGIATDEMMRYVHMFPEIFTWMLPAS